MLAILSCCKPHFEELLNTPYFHADHTRKRHKNLVKNEITRRKTFFFTATCIWTKELTDDKWVHREIQKIYKRNPCVDLLTENQ